MSEPRPKKIVIKGKEYGSLDEMPPEVRAFYEKAAALAADKDGDGVADIFQGKGIGGIWSATKQALSLAQEARELGIESMELPESKASAPSPAVPPPSAQAASHGPPEPIEVGGGTARKLFFGIIVAALVVLALRELGLLS